MQKESLYGSVTATVLNGSSLPYVDNLVNLVVAEDLGEVSMDEVTRVLAPLIRFEAKSGEDLYLGAKKIDWTNIMRMDQTFAVFANVSYSGIDNSHFASLKVKDCVVDMIRKLSS